MILMAKQDNEWISIYFIRKDTYMANVALKNKQSVEIVVVTILQSFVENQIEQFFYNLYLIIIFNNHMTIVGE